jgi:hypothetical protein
MCGSSKTRRLFKKALSHPPTRHVPRHTPFPYQGHSEPFIRSLWALGFCRTLTLHGFQERCENAARGKARPWAKRLSWQPQGGRVR